MTDHTASPAAGTTAATPDGGPAVLAVVVAHDPGDWFAETLESLALQDYDNLRTAVVDAAGSDIGARVAEVVRDATVIDAAGAGGFAEAANAVLAAATADSADAVPAAAVAEAEYLLVCHDDVALAPDTVGILVAEAERSNAGVVGPKIVDWDRPEIIQHAGYDVDRFGVPAERVGLDELDQEQQDGVNDVFALPSAVLLIRRELFMRLGGFDAGMTFRGEDVDFCWRAQMAGARVMFVGDAVARHRSRLVERTGVDDIRITETRHALRTMLVNHGRISLALFVPAAAVMAAAEILLAFFTARFGRVGEVVSAWGWNVSRLDVIFQRRRINATVRRVRQADVTALQYFGSVRLVSLLRRQAGGESSGFLGAPGRVLGGLRTGTTRLTVIAWALVIAVVVFGSRRLVTDGVAAVGDFAALPGTGSELLESWYRGWSERSGGAPSSNLGVLAYLGALGWFLNDAMGLIRTLAVIAPILVGLLGAYRLLAATGSRRAQAATLVAYLLVPLLPASVSSGSMAGLVGYGAAPWLLAGLLKASATAPFRPAPDRRSPLLAAAVTLGAAAGIAALVVPAAAGLVFLLAAGLVAGSLLAGRPGGVIRLLAATVVATPVMAVLGLPMVVDLLASGGSWSFIADGRDGSAGVVSFAEIVAMALGPNDPSSVVWVFAVPMAVPLLLGRGWRLEQSVRLWMVAVVAWALALAAQRGALPFGVADLHLILAPAAVAVAALCGMAVVSIEHDLRFSHFGWRQAMVPLTAVAAAVLAVSSIASLQDGRWGLVPSDHQSALRFEPPSLAGDYRVLWIGAPEFLNVEGRALAPGVAWATTTGDAVTILDRAVPLDEGRADLFETVIGEITDANTVRGGRLLAGVGVRYVVLLHRLAPAPFVGDDEARPVPASISDPMRNQLDLALVEGTNSAVDMFVNTAWVPMRALHPPDFDAGVAEITDLAAHPLAAGVPLFSGDGPPWSADIPDGAEVLVAQTPRPGWELTVDGEPATRREALSWARAYLPAAGGEARLSYSAPWWRHAGQLAGTAAPLALVLAWLRRRMDRF